MKKLSIVFLVIIGAAALIAIASSSSNSTSTPAPTPQATQQATKDDANLQRAILGARSLRAAMRNPDSFKLASVHVKDSGSVCYSYRAQNGFGGMNLENAVLAPGAPGLNPNASAWNSQCAHKNGVDVTDQVNDFLARVGGQ
jgi:hypothetical protein